MGGAGGPLDGNGWNFDPHEEWGSPENNFAGYGTENFFVLGGSGFYCDPQTYGSLDRDIDTVGGKTNEIGSHLPQPEVVGDIVISKDLWENLRPSLRESLSAETYPEDHIPVNFTETEMFDEDSRRYTGFLRTVEDPKYEVVIETEDYPPANSVRGHPMA